MKCMWCGSERDAPATGPHVCMPERVRERALEEAAALLLQPIRWSSRGRIREFKADVLMAASDAVLSLRGDTPPPDFVDDETGSALRVRLCPHDAWREKYGCPKCDAAEARAARPCRHCGRVRSEHASDTRRCPEGGTAFWPLGEPGGG